MSCVPYPIQWACGPPAPNADSEANTSAGLRRCSASAPTPRRSATPAEKFSIATSETAARSCTTRTPSALLRLTPTLSLPRWLALHQPQPSGLPGATDGFWVRRFDGRGHHSMFTTSAPRSASTVVANGPAHAQVRSSTRNPSSGSEVGGRRRRSGRGRRRRRVGDGPRPRHGRCARREEPARREVGVGGKVGRPADGRRRKVGVLQPCDELVDPCGGDPPVEHVVDDLAFGDQLAHQRRVRQRRALDAPGLGEQARPVGRLHGLHVDQPVGRLLHPARGVEHGGDGARIELGGGDGLLDEGGERLAAGRPRRWPGGGVRAVRPTRRRAAPRRRTSRRRTRRGRRPARAHGPRRGHRRSTS